MRAVWQAVQPSGLARAVSSGGADAELVAIGDNGDQAETVTG